MRTWLDASRGQDFTFFAVRWVLLFGFAFALVLVRGGLQRFSLDRDSDILLALALGAVANVLIGASLLLQWTRRFAPLLMLISDVVIAGLFARLAVDDVVLWVGFASALMVMANVRLGWTWGAIASVGIVGISILAAYSAGKVNLFPIILPSQYVAGALIMSLVGFAAAISANVMNVENGERARTIRKLGEESAERVNIMRERIKGVADLATTLIATTQYDKILDVTMDIGRLCVRHDPKQRLLCMTLLVETEEELSIATSRGLHNLDQNRHFKGESGILAQTIRQGKPMILAQNAAKDPELSTLISFSSIESVLCVPLRAGYNTYGVLVYASTEPDLFNADNLDAMQAIGVQTTIALQNSFLYASLMEEKERLIRIEENARKALVRDLHDIPTQTISAVAMQLPLIPMIAERQPQTLRAEVDKLRDMALRAVEEIRHVMFALRPLSLETSGLSSALTQLAEKMGKTYGQNMKVTVDPNAEYHLSQEQQGTLFYLIEEASNNARKHAQASLIDVRVILEGHHVVTRVQDNGKGFDMAQVGRNYEGRGSFGMVNMRERAELIGGQLDMKSAPGRGTLITVMVPVALKGSGVSVRAKADGRKKLDRPYSGPMSPSK